MLFGGRSSGQAASGGAGRAPVPGKIPDEPWIVRDGRYVPNPNWVNTAPNLEYWAAFGPPAVGAAAAFLPGAVAFARLGKELKFGRNVRIAPFGNRPADRPRHPIGRWLHYHRRGTEEGQGINRHRPWEKRSPDRSFWDRF